MPEPSSSRRPAALPSALQVDLGSGQAHLTHKGRVLALRGRWDGAFLKSLIDGGHGSAVQAADAALLQQVLRAQGLAAPLSATQWGRIVDRLRVALERLDESGALARRLCHAPRAKTTGPWWWQDDGRSAVAPARAATPRAAALSGGPWAAGAEVPAALALALDPHGDAGVRLLGRFKRAMEAVWKADKCFYTLNQWNIYLQ